MKRQLDWLAIGLGVILSLGCATDRFAWTEGRGELSAGVASESTITGQLAQIRRQADRAGQMGLQEQVRAASALTEIYRNATTPAVRQEVLRTLGEFSHESAVDGLRVGMESADPILRSEACRSLARLPHSAAMDLLIRTLDADPDVDVRQEAALALGQFQDRRAVRALGQALEDVDPAVQYVAMDALRRITGENLGHDVRQWKRVALESAEGTGR